MRKGKVFQHEQLAGYIWENEEGFFFQYSPEYLSKKDVLKGHMLNLQ